MPQGVSFTHHGTYPEVCGGTACARHPGPTPAGGTRAYQTPVDEVAPLPGEVVIDKPGKSAFYATDLEALPQARGIRYLLVTGVTTDVCCTATVIAANDRGYHAIVLEDCVAPTAPGGAGCHPGPGRHLRLGE